MHRQQHTQEYYTREQLFHDRFPLSVVAILAVIQMITTLGIIALEIGHIIIDIQLTNLFAGIWTSLPFTILWISMFATVCCCRRRSCATHAVVQNCISFVFASALIGINIAFLRRPFHCFFTERICNDLSWTHHITLPFDCFNGNQDGCENTRLSLIKVQLAAAVLMAVTCAIYLMIYCIVASRVSRAHRRQVSAAADAVMTPVYPAPINYQHQPYMYQPSAPMMMPGYHQVSPGNNNGNYVPGIYPNISNNRF